jgi:hypothetical protein
MSKEATTNRARLNAIVDRLLGKGRHIKGFFDSIDWKRLGDRVFDSKIPSMMFISLYTILGLTLFLTAPFLLEKNGALLKELFAYLKKDQDFDPSLSVGIAAFFALGALALVFLGFLRAFMRGPPRRRMALSLS